MHRNNFFKTNKSRLRYGRGTIGASLFTIVKVFSQISFWFRLSIAGGATLLIGMGLGRFSFSPLIPALIETGILTSQEAGIIAASNFAGYLLGALIAPILRLFFGEIGSMKYCLVFALLSLFACILPWGFWWLVFWRALLGALVGIMMIYCLAIATRYAPTGKLGAATGIVYTGVGIGILLSGSLIPWLLSFSLAIAWMGIAFIGLTAFLVAFWGWTTPMPDKNNSTPASQNLSHQKFRWNSTVIGLISARTLFSLGLIPHTIYWVDYLVRGLGNGIDFGGMHWALFGSGAILGTYLWGRLADQIGFRFGVGLAFTAVAAGIALPVIYTAGWALILSSLVVGAQPGLTAILSGRFHQLVGADRMASVWRMSALVATVIQAIGAYGYVTLFAMFDDYTTIFLAGSASMALGAVIALTLKRPETV